MQRFRDYLSNPSKIFLCWYLVSTKAQLALALLKNVPKANWSSFSTSFIDTGSSVLFFFPAFTACMTSLVISLMSFNSLVQTLIFCSFSLSLVPEEQNEMTWSSITGWPHYPPPLPQHFYVARYIFILIVKGGFMRAACVRTLKYKSITGRCLYPDFGIGSSEHRPLGHCEHYFRAWKLC